jgi:hypothetical protein
MIGSLPFVLSGKTPRSITSELKLVDLARVGCLRRFQYHIALAAATPPKYIKIIAILENALDMNEEVDFEFQPSCKKNILINTYEL